MNKWFENPECTKWFAKLKKNVCNSLLVWQIIHTEIIVLNKEEQNKEQTIFKIVNVQKKAEV